MVENNIPRFDDYTLRPKRERGLTEEDDARDRLRHAWPAYALVGFGLVVLLSVGIVLGVLMGEGLIAGAIGVVSIIAYFYLRYAGIFGSTSEDETAHR